MSRRIMPPMTASFILAFAFFGLVLPARGESAGEDTGEPRGADIGDMLGAWAGTERCTSGNAALGMVISKTEQGYLAKYRIADKTPSGKVRSFDGQVTITPVQDKTGVYKLSVQMVPWTILPIPKVPATLRFFPGTERLTVAMELGPFAAVAAAGGSGALKGKRTQLPYTLKAHAGGLKDSCVGTLKRVPEKKAAKAGGSAPAD